MAVEVHPDPENMIAEETDVVGAVVANPDSGQRRRVGAKSGGADLLLRLRLWSLILKILKMPPKSGGALAPSSPYYATPLLQDLRLQCGHSCVCSLAATFLLGLVVQTKETTIYRRRMSNIALKMLLTYHHLTWIYYARHLQFI